MTYVLIIMSSIAITGFPTEGECITARNAVIRQFGRNLDAGAICVQVPAGGEVIAGGRRTGR
jgi:hypothetical protein